MARAKHLVKWDMAALLEQYAMDEPTGLEAATTTGE
jgi:hypothetical protein